MRLVNILDDAYTFTIFQKELYIGSKGSLIIISSKNIERKIIHNGKINSLSVYFDRLFFQEHQKELYIFDGQDKTKFHEGRFSLSGAILNNQILLLCKIDSSSRITICSVNKDLELKCGLSVEEYNISIENIIITKSKKIIKGLNKVSLKEIWKWDHNKVLALMENQLQINPIFGHILIPHQDNIIIPLKEGQILSLYSKTGALNWFFDRKINSIPNGIYKVSLFKNKLYGFNSNYLVEVDADTGQETRELSLKEATDKGCAPTQLSTFEDYIILYEYVGWIIIVNRKKFKIEEVFRCAGSIITAPNKVMWFNNRLYVSSSNMHLEESVRKEGKLVNVGRRETILVYER